jgi:hypothetical protein
MQNNNNETIWKKQIFSDTYEDTENIDNDFQTVNMNEKIKKIKKNKVKNNYKNIETFDNIYESFEGKDFDIFAETTPAPTTTPTPTKKNKKSKKSKKTDKSPSQEKKCTNSVFDSKCYDGLDKGDKVKKVQDPRERLVNFLKSIYNKIVAFNRAFAKRIADILSNYTDTDKDVDLLEKYISYFESIVMGYFFAYNFFYVTYFRTPDGKRIEKPQLDSNYIKEKSVNSIFYKIITFVFIYIVYIIEFFERIINERFPNFIESKLNAPAYMIILFLSITYIIQVFSKTLLNFLIDMIMCNTKNIIVDFIYAFVFCYFIYE